jgi:hypothetical protein
VSTSQDFHGGAEFAKVPRAPGLYAWYYKPVIADPAVIARALASFLGRPGELHADVMTRYGLRLSARSPLAAQYGSDRKSPEQVVEDAVAVAEGFVADFFTSEALQHFTRPIYIGIARNLYDRIYDGHYAQLDDLWDSASRVSRFMTAHPGTSVDEVASMLNLKHSFALEARVRGIAPRDLLVRVYAIQNLPVDIGRDEDDAPSRRALERLLQLIADPIFGRR